MYTISLDNRGDAIFHAESRGYRFDLGPAGAGANAGDTLLAGLCACVGHYVRQYLKERGLNEAGFTLRAEADSTPDESRLARIRVFIGPRVSLDAAASGELLERAGRCKIYKTLALACPVTLELDPAVAAEAHRVSDGRAASGHVGSDSCCG